MILKDFLGREIFEGSDVVYPGRSGANLWMNYGTVEKIEGTRLLVRRTPLSLQERPRLVWITEVKRVVCVI